MTKVGIIGIGFVGGALRNWFENGDIKNDVELFLYDKYKNIGSIKEVNKANIIFICVPTPYGKNGFDLSAVEEAAKAIRGKKTVVIKSTVLPGTTENFQRRFREKTFFFNPEFLREKSAKQDFLKPDRQIIGVAASIKNKKIINNKEAELILKILPKAPNSFIIRSREAEMIKYFSNNFLTTKVIFANQIYDICAAAGIEYDVVKNIAGLDPRIGTSHLNINEGDYRGYGGTCFPKDIRAMIQFAKSVKVNPELFALAEKINNNLNGGKF